MDWGRTPLDERLFGRVAMGSAPAHNLALGRCWIFTGHPADAALYGRIRVDGRKRGPHAVAWELEHGQPVPPGHEVDHLCKTPGCVRPGHLDAVPPRVNLERSRNATGVILRYGVCQRGHPWVPENIS